MPEAPPPEPPQVRRDRGGRELGVAVLGGAAAGGLAFLGANRAWAAVQVVSPGVPRTLVETTGIAAVPWVGALSLVVVAAALALLPTGGRLRQAVAVVLGLAAAGVAVGAALAGGPLGDALLEDVLAEPAAAGLEAQAVAAAAEQSAWRWLTLLGGVVGVAVGGWTCTRAGRWPVMGSRYEAPGSGGAPARPEPTGASADTDLWRALDRGEDPTAPKG